MFQLNGTPISIDNEYTTEDGVTYPHLRDPAVREALGVVEVPDPQDYDQRFYWGPDNPKDLDQLKAQWIAQVKATANSLMAPTDWMVIRQLFKGIGMSALVENYRDAVVAESNRLEAAITATTTVEELIAVINAQAWPQQ